MNREDFEKLVKAMKKMIAYANHYDSIDEALQLLREIFNANGGAERFLFKED